MVTSAEEVLAASSGRERSALGHLLLVHATQAAARGNLAAAHALMEVRREMSDAEAGSRARDGLRIVREPLSPRELEVVLAAVEGASNKEIAERLFLSVKTVEAHLGSSFRKLGIRRRSQLAVVALSF